jgi:hypothetical protein
MRKNLAHYCNVMSFWQKKRLEKYPLVNITAIIIYVENTIPQLVNN